MIRLLLRLLGVARRSLTLIVIAALLTTNVLAFTSSAFIGLVGSAAGAVGLKTVQTARAARTASVARRLVGRTAARGLNIVRRLPAKVVPVIGVPAVVTFAAFDVRDACATLELASELDGDSAADVPESMATLCDLDFGDGWALLDHVERAAKSEAPEGPETAEAEVWR